MDLMSLTAIAVNDSDAFHFLIAKLKRRDAASTFGLESAIESTSQLRSLGPPLAERQGYSLCFSAIYLTGL
jgi:hypothetical protein